MADSNWKENFSKPKKSSKGVKRKRGFISDLVAELGYRDIKYQYFMWRNKLENVKKNYGILTREEFIKQYCQGSLTKLKYLEQWEQTEQYNKLLKKLYASNMDKDLLEIYNKVREKAMDGDDKAIKTFIMLQKEIKNINTSSTIGEETGEGNTDNDDGLELEL